jgi:hypothetical protein
MSPLPNNFTCKIDFTTTTIRRQHCVIYLADLSTLVADTTNENEKEE